MGEVVLEDAAISEDALAVRRRIGTRIGDWTVFGLLAVGSTAAIYEAIGDEGESVALRVLAGSLCATPSARSRFTDEIGLTLLVEHPARVSVIAQGETEDGAPYVALELVDGDPIDEILRREGALPLDEALAIAEQLVDCIASSHAVGLIHGSVTPAKLLRPRSSGDGSSSPSRIRVLECGAREWAGRDRIGGPGVVDDDAMEDLTAASVVLYARLSGHRVSFMRPREADVVRAAHAVVESMPHAVPFESAIAALMTRAIRRGPSSFRTALEMRDAIASVREGLVWNAAFLDVTEEETRVCDAEVDALLDAPLPSVEGAPIVDALGRVITGVHRRHSADGSIARPRLQLVEELDDTA